MSRKEDEYLIERMSNLLAEIAIIVNGLPPNNISWSYHDLPEKVRALKQAPPAHVEAWLYEVRFSGTGKNPPTDWQRYGVYTSRADAERGMAVCGGELEGRVTPLVRAAARATDKENGNG